MEEPVLERCPICTSDPQLYEDTWTGYAFICPVCSESAPILTFSKSEAVRIWNEYVKEIKR